MTRFEIVRKVILADAGLPAKFAATLGLLVVASVLGEGARGISGPVPIVPFAPYYPAVLLVALFVDWRWAVGAMVASMPIAGRLFIKPLATAGMLSVTGIWERYVLFTFACLVLIWVGDTLRRTVRQMAKLARERDLLASEMLHRVGNTLSIVDALIRLANKEADTEQFSRELSGRVRALAKANQAVLKSSGREVAEVSQLIADAIRPFSRPDAFSMSGPEAWLPDNAAHYLMLIVHELSTNALKHGALSTEGGRVSVTWTEGKDGLDLVWQELGGPEVREPERRGLGMRLMQAQSIFNATIRFEPEGLYCNLRTRRQFSPSEGAEAIASAKPSVAPIAVPLPVQPVSGA